MGPPSGRLGRVLETAAAVAAIWPATQLDAQNIEEPRAEETLF
jgi:hypothetical protein